MAGKRLEQNNAPVVSPTDFQERKAKQDIENRRLASVDALNKRVRELEAAEKAYTAKIDELQAEKEALGAQLLDVQQDCIRLQKEKTEMEDKMKTFGADAPLEDPINEEDLKLEKEPAKARQLPKKTQPEAEDREEDEDEEAEDKRGF